MVETKNAPVVDRLRAAGDDEAAQTIERLERAIVDLYREHQTACALARDANRRILEILDATPTDGAAARGGEP